MRKLHPTEFIAMLDAWRIDHGRRYARKFPPPRRKDAEMWRLGRRVSGVVCNSSRPEMVLLKRAELQLV